MNIPDVEKGGPLFFKVMMDIIASNTKEAISTLISRYLLLNYFYLRSKHQEGSQSTMYSEKVTPDISDLLINVFCNTSVDSTQTSRP